MPLEVRKLAQACRGKKNEEVKFEKIEAISNEQILVYYTVLKGNNSYMRIDKIDLEKNEC